jgi:excisionase family DNA binding protein
MPDEKRPPQSEVHSNRFPSNLKEPLLDSRQAAAILRIHPRTLQRLVHRGQIGAVQVGKLWRFKPSTLEEWIDKLNCA